MTHHIEAERSVIGGIMLDNNMLDDVLDVLESRHFYSNAHQHIFDSIVDLSLKNNIIDLVTLTNNLKKSGSLEKIGGLEYLDSIVRCTPSSANVLSYAEIVYDSAIEREMQRIADKVPEILHSEGTTQEKLDVLQSQVTMLSEKKNTAGAKRIDSLVAGAIDEIEFRAEKNGVLGLSTGLAGLDEKLCGIEKGDVVVIAGTPGTGKTSLAMNLVQNITKQNDKSALIFSLEMTERQLVMRSISTMSKVPFNLIRSGSIHSNHHTAIAKASSELKMRNIYVDDSGGLSILNIRSRARKIHRKNTLDLIVIDYLQIMSGEGKSTNERLERITPAIKSLAKELNLPIILLSQFNREGARKKPQISDLRGSGSIEQDADTIIMLWTHGENELRPNIEAIIGKQRSGETGSSWLLFDRPILKMVDIDPPRFEEKENERGFL